MIAGWSTSGKTRGHGCKGELNSTAAIRLKFCRNGKANAGTCAQVAQNVTADLDPAASRALQKESSEVSEVLQALSTAR